jgi:HD-like signal output (HDOD) protein
MTDDRRIAASKITIDLALEVSLRDIGIPPRPAILDGIGQEMRRPEPDFRHLTTLISADVGLAAGLLKIVNSAYFGFQTRARTVIHALMMLGLDVTSRAIAGLILRRVFRSVPGMDGFWDKSARIARTSGWVTQQLGAQKDVRADEAYTFGLFRDCGLAILLRKFPDYAEVLRIADVDGERLYTAIEDARCPTNHAIVGCLLAQDWWLPADTSTAIRHHHDAIALGAGTRVLSTASAYLVAISQLSEHLVQRATGQYPNREWDKLGSVCLTQLGLDDADITSLERAVPLDVVSDLI